MISSLLFLLLQPATEQAPDIHFQASVRARQVEVRSSGEASLTVSASPDAGSEVVVRKSPENNGSRRLRNVDITLDAKANIADPQQIQVEAETSQPE